uniref:Kelch-like protein 10 n=1 Tax=Gouania willdenowi TaxID=441366 RepID=A0A8C5ETF3_GOUWI
LKCFHLHMIFIVRTFHKLLGLSDFTYSISDNSNNFDLMMEVHQFNVKSLEQTCFDVLKDHLCPENCIGLWQFSGINNTLFCRRLPNAVLLITAERYQPNINQWTFIASMNEERIRASCTTLNNKIYICGGRSNRVLNTAEYYNPDTNQWTLITPMGTPRCDLGVVAYMGHIFTVGGRDGFRDLRSAEAYDPVTNTCNRVLNTAEYYNPDTNQWTLITPMGTPRCDLGVVAYMGHIFAVGGRDGFRDLRSAEAYDPVTNTWYDVPEMVHRHRYFDIAVMNKQIFVVSCRTGKIVECYDYTTNTWSVVFSGMDHNDWVKCCVISGLPNMAEYCSPREPIIPRTQV